MVPVDVAELEVHERVELDGDVGGGVEPDERAGVADGGGVGGDDEGQPAADGAPVERGDGECEAGGESREEAHGGRVERAARCRGGHRQVPREADGVVVEVRVAEQLERGEGEGRVVETHRGGVSEEEEEESGEQDEGRRRGGRGERGHCGRHWRWRGDCETFTWAGARGGVS